jgi:hypothetical protein
MGTSGGVIGNPSAGNKKILSGILPEKNAVINGKALYVDDIVATPLDVTGQIGTRPDDIPASH